TSSSSSSSQTITSQPWPPSLLQPRSHQSVATPSPSSSFIQKQQTRDQNSPILQTNNKQSSAIPSSQQNIELLSSNDSPSSQKGRKKSPKKSRKSLDQQEPTQDLSQSKTK